MAVKDFYPKGESISYYGIDDIQIKFVERYDEVYKCDLDSDDCNLDGNPEHKILRFFDKIQVDKNIFTDFSSTSKNPNHLK